MRIVSLLASATEMINELGCLEQLVGRSHECDYPPEVMALPVVSKVQIDIETSSANIDAQIRQLAQEALTPANAAMKALSIYTIDIELLQALQPDIIFTQTQCEVCAVSERDVVQAVQQLAGLHPQIVSLAPYWLNDVWNDVLRVGEALGRPELAEHLVDGYKKVLVDLLERTSRFGEKPRVVVLEWLDPLMAAGNWTPELVSYAGGEHILSQVGLHSSWLNWQELQQADPDLIVLSPCGYSIERTMLDVPLLQQHLEWQKLKAVQNGRVYIIDGNQYLNRSGPRLVDSAQLLARVIWGERLDVEVDEQSWTHVL